MTTFTEYEAQHLVVLNRIAIALETLAMANAPAPAFMKPLGEYKSFDWNSIGATASATDRYGVSEVEWGGYTWKRRSPSNNFAEAIYYSRPIGKKPDGSNNYARLITFKNMGAVKPISREAEAAVEAAPVKPDQAPRPVTPEPEPTLDEVFGPNPRKAQTELVETWPANEVEFNAWSKQNGYNGKETHDALGCDAKSWLKQNPGLGWADVSKTIKATMGK